MVLKKLVLFVFLSSFPFIGFAIDINEMRIAFTKSVEDETLTRKWVSILKETPKLSPLEKGFAGAFETLLAKHAWNPYFKLDYLKKGSQKLNLAILEDKESIELRFLRYSIEHYLPTFLGYGQNIQADKKLIINQINNYQKQNLDLKTILVIAKFLLESKRCNEQEIKLIQDFIKIIS